MDCLSKMGVERAEEFCAWVANHRVPLLKHSDSVKEFHFENMGSALFIWIVPCFPHSENGKLGLA